MTEVQHTRLFDSCNAAAQIFWLLGDRGTPYDYIHMEGFGIHTAVLIKKEGKETYIKFKWEPKAGEYRYHVQCALVLKVFSIWLVLLADPRYWHRHGIVRVHGHSVQVQL